MTPKRPTDQLLKRVVPALAVWGVGKALEMPQVKARIRKIDDRVYEKRRKAVAGVKHYAKNVAKNGAWFATGAAAFVLGIGLMAKAAKK